MVSNIRFAVLGAILLSIQISALPQGERTDCIQGCPLFYVPVCASDGVETKTFANECEMEYSACIGNKDFRIVQKGECNAEKTLAMKKDCPSCNKMYKPVCGSDGKESKTFSNECLMRSTNCLETRKFEHIQNGPCNAEKTLAMKKDCPSCNKMYKPVCGSDGQESKTFSNECLMRSTNCLETRKFQHVQNGPCNTEKTLAMKKDCPSCNKMYKPICGSDGKESKTFSNECLMRSTNCLETRKFEHIQNGPCNAAKDLAAKKDCPSCNKMYKPICGSDGQESKTFSNECLMRSTNCLETREFQHVQNGPCADKGSDSDAKKIAERGCKPCTKIYRPVCGATGSNKKTFPNECMMVFFNCMESADYKVLRSGKC